MQLNALEPLLKIFYIFIYKIFFSCRLKFPYKNFRQLYGKSKASQCLEKFKHSYVPPKTHVGKILCCVALEVYKSKFFFRTVVLRKLFDILHFSDNVETTLHSSIHTDWQINNGFLTDRSLDLALFTINVLQKKYKNTTGFTTNFPQNIETEKFEGVTCS